MVDAQFLPTSEPAGGQRLCFGNPDTSVGDGSRCGGRRQLDGEDLSAVKDEKIRWLEAELEKSRAESVEKDRIILQQTKVNERQANMIQKQANEIAFHKRLRRLRQNTVTPHNVSDSRHNQTAVGRRTQASDTSDASVLKSARVGAERLVKACAVHPCDLSDGLCQNGGSCVEGAAEGGGAVPFECQCAPGYVGERCETDLCVAMGMGCGDHGHCIGGSCECESGWVGDHCDTNLCATVDCGSGTCHILQLGETKWGGRGDSRAACRCACDRIPCGHCQGGCPYSSGGCSNECAPIGGNNPGFPLYHDGCR